MVRIVNLCLLCFIWKTRCALFEAIVSITVPFSFEFFFQNYCHFWYFMSLMGQFVYFQNVADVLPASFIKHNFGFEII